MQTRAIEHVTKRILARDFAATLAISDARKAENAAARTRAQMNTELCAVLLADAQRRGQKVIAWAEYFRNNRI